MSGGLVLVLVLLGCLLMDDSGYPRNRGNQQDEDKHKAPASAPHRPLSLRTRGEERVLRRDKYRHPTRPYTGILDVCERIRGNVSGMQTSARGHDWTPYY